MLIGPGVRYRLLGSTPPPPVVSRVWHVSRSDQKDLEDCNKPTNRYRRRRPSLTNAHVHSTMSDIGLYTLLFIDNN